MKAITAVNPDNSQTGDILSKMWASPLQSHATFKKNNLLTPTVYKSSRDQTRIFVQQLLLLARSAAALFVDRHKTAIDNNRFHLAYNDYLFDFNHALHHSSLSPELKTQIALEPEDFYPLYNYMMIQESKRLAERCLHPYCRKDVSNGEGRHPPPDYDH